MFFGRKRKIREETEIQELEQSLRQFAKVDLGLEDKRKMKAHLVTMIEKFSAEERYSSDLFRLRQQVQRAGARIKPSLKDRMLMKERIMAFIDRTSRVSLAFGRSKAPVFFRELLTAALLLCFVVTIVFVAPLQVPVTLAAHLTYLEDFSGNVSVLRDGKIYSGTKHFSLEEGDKVITDDKGLATVHFFDDSTSRLGKNTELQLKRLYSEPFHPIVTQIEISLMEGQLWTRVVNLVDNDSQFVVDTDQTRAIVNKKAAFDFQVVSSKDILTVFDNVVGFSIKDDGAFQSKPVLAGFQAQVDHNQAETPPTILPVDKVVGPDSSQHAWFASNLQKDVVRAQKLVVEKEGNLESNTDSKTPLVSTDKISSDTDIIANAEIEHQRQNFLESYRFLQVGETLLMHNQRIQGLKLMYQFQNGLRNFLKKNVEFKVTDPLNAALFQSFMERKIAEQRKDLATFLPGDPLYPAKEFFEETALLLVDSDIDRTLMQLTQAEDKLLEIQDLVTKGNLNQANGVLGGYKRQMDAFVLKVNPDTTTDFKNKLVPLLNRQFDHIKVLTSIEKSLDGHNQQTFLRSIRKIRYDVLGKFIATLRILPGAVPPRLIHELKDLLQTYLASAVRDDQFITTLNELLVSRGEKDMLQSFILIPKKLGVVTIIEDKTSPAEPPTIPLSHTQETQEVEESTKKLPPPDLLPTDETSSVSETEERTEPPTVSGPKEEVPLE